MGSIEVIFGPMFSGKTQELQRRLRRHRSANNKFVLLRPSEDTRNNSSPILTTHDHDGGSMEGVFVDNTRLMSCYVSSDIRVIGIDEGQFFFDLIEFCVARASEGRVVIVAALDADYRCRPFTIQNGDRKQTITDLVAYASKVDKLCGVCKICHQDASFSRRLGKETAVILPGSDGDYIAVCSRCYQLADETIASALRDSFNQ